VPVIGGFIDPPWVLAAERSSSRLAKIFHRVVTRGFSRKFSGLYREFQIDECQMA